MSTIETKVNNRSEEFLANATQMQGLVEDLEETVAGVRKGGGEQYQQRHLSRGKLLPLRTGCMAGISPQPVLSPASAGWPARSA